MKTITSVPTRAGKPFLEQLKTRQADLAQAKTNEPIKKLNGFDNHVKRGVNAALAELNRIEK